MKGGETTKKVTLFPKKCIMLTKGEIIYKVPRKAEKLKKK